MRKLTALAICSALLLTLTACHSTIPDNWQGDETTTQTTTSTTAVTTAPLVIEPAPVEVVDYLHNNFERFMIDGSTSMVPLHQSLNNLFGDSRNIYHRRTVFAFEN
ncbi:MAG: hypothetical protein FWD34_04325, partial [Oscillospiraceae bacterium]|nr:hypothetical protein [Oscillospiraceae bacterium]